MSARTVPVASLVGWAVFAACCVAFGFLSGGKPSLWTLAAPAALGWFAVLFATRPMVEADRRPAHYFALSVLALMIFFVHQTYGYEGKVRNFPLIVVYLGIFLCLLDIASLTRHGAGAVIAKFFGAQMEEVDPGRRTVRRELIVFAAMGGCVLGIWLIGFLVFSPIFVIAWMIAGGRTVRHSIYCGLGTLVFIYLLFELAFKYELFRGVLFIWLMDL